MATKLSLSKLQQDIHAALQLWHEASTAASPLDYLQLWQQARLGKRGNARQVTNKVLFEALEILAIEHKAEADLLRRRFLDGMMMHAVANQLNVGESTAYRKQQEAIKRLALVVQEREAQARISYQSALEKRLKLPPDVSLFGVKAQLNILQEVLLAPEPVWVASVEGLGGIGKTALANALIRRPELTGRFRTVAWVSAKQHEFLADVERAQLTSPALTSEALTDMLLEQLDNTISLTQSPPQKQAVLTKLLKDAPYLIVIDNLETVVDYRALLPVLREWANPSKFILTSRHSLRTQSDVFCCSLEELSQADALRFIRHEAQTRGGSLLANASDADLKRIYQVVGGNPLAIKLVVGQISVLPLSQVLENLKQARGKKIEALYTFIYWQAWHMLEPNSQQTLLVMPLAQDGGLDQLLAQVGGDLEVRRYTIHHLTETFLLQEAIQWQTSA